MDFVTDVGDYPHWATDIRYECPIGLLSRIEPACGVEEDGMSVELQKAIDCLRIRDVYLRSSSSYLVDDFDPKYSPEANELAAQFKHVVARGEVLALKEEDAGIRIFRVYIDLGARWVVLPESTSENESEEKDDEADVKAVIEATFLTEYSMEDEPGQDALDAFAPVHRSWRTVGRFA